MKPECDIILLSYENPELLKKCVRSVLDHTRVRSRLIIVDNASRDPEVARYLHGVHGNANVSVEKIFSEENAGFAAGMNKGLRLSEAPFLCLLNNDCMVTDGWLEEMITIASANPDVGLVNPQSNTFGSRPDAEISVDGHAALLSDRKGKFVELGHAIGFACLIKREVMDRIGYLDEAYQGVCYEDTDFSVRARKAGFIPVMAEGAYVHHEEQASRKDLKGKDGIYRRNKEIFEKRWGRLLRVFFLDRSSGTEGHMLENYEIFKDIARERAIVEIWIRHDRMKEEVSSGFDRRKMIRHADIGINVFSKRHIGLAVLWKVLTKKKKYDAVIMEKGLLLRLLRILKPFHGAEILAAGEGARVTSASGREFDLRKPEALAEYLRGKGRKR